MSTWYEVEEYDIDHKDKEIRFYVHSNDYGRTYLILSFEQLKEIATKINVTTADKPKLGEPKRYVD